jgi:hypothetical protein
MAGCDTKRLPSMCAGPLLDCSANGTELGDETLNNLDFPALIDRIGDGLDDLHVLQTFTKAGLG